MKIWNMSGQHQGVDESKQWPTSIHTSLEQTDVIALKAHMLRSRAHSRLDSGSGGVLGTQGLGQRKVQQTDVGGISLATGRWASSGIGHAQ